MKITCAVFVVLLWLVFSSAPAWAVFSYVPAARIPEHQCHKLIPWSICDLQKCIQECSKQPGGMGVCLKTNCFCTFYCTNPPQLYISP
ncbi:hypothetical protein RGQ29_023004 [Quercus rubra]|uniref:Uncharacterized protein n=1 Tax=Quercus rubra TaxID=3512 RepID=A0AAN7F448_QUERU|nr:hypothetical protein RGQ29_023004 [Quercus rubra]